MIGGRLVPGQSDRDLRLPRRAHDQGHLRRLAEEVERVDWRHVAGPHLRKPIGAAQLELEDVLRNCDTTEGHLIEDDEVLWHVERLCGKRAADDGIQYWVEWAGDYKKSQKY